MYPVVPSELLVDGIQFLCYFFTVLAALVGCVMARS